MDLSLYYDAYWQRVGDRCDVNRLQLLLAYVQPGERVLEVDCGPGVLARMMMDKGALVEATEMSREAVQRAREKGVPVQHVDLDAQDGRLPYPDNAFDTVVSNSAIEHRFFHEKHLDECVRVLKPGGRLILCLPNIAHWRCRLWLLAGRFPYVRNSPTDPSHLRFFTVYEARKLCRERGVVVERVDGSASLWVPGFYPGWLRRPPLDRLYTWLARHYPGLFARDFILVGRKGASPA
jgi:methionine biosynthesis protein MetW